MNEAMKQRLLGAIIIGCLAIIFIPLILDGEGYNPAGFNNEVPPRPVMPEVIESQPVRPRILADTEVTASLSVPEAVTEEVQVADPASEDPLALVVADPAPLPATPLDTQGLPDAWSVRLASFAQAANAEALVNRLREQNYTAYSSAIESALGSMTAVFVGPVLSRNEANALQRELADNFDLNGMVVEFSVIDTSR